MGGFFLGIRTWWETADRTQRAVTLFGGAFLVLLLGGTYFFASKPRFELVAGGLTPAEQAAAVTELQQMGMPVQAQMDGSVLVPSNKVADARQRLAASGKLPSGGHLGVGALDTMGMMASPRVEREKLKAVLEGEVARAIEKIDGVAGAQVNLTLGDDSAFAAERSPATANVTLVERANGGVGFDQAKSIARMVANSVQGLDTKNVSIVNQQGQALWDGVEQSGSGGTIARKLEAEIAESRRRERELQGMLDAAFGPGNTVAKVTVELDFDKSSEVKNATTPSETPLVVESNKETMTGGGAGTNRGAPSGLDGVLGTPAAASGGDGSQGYEGKQEAKTFASTQTETRTEKSSGQLLSMSVTVVVDKEKISDQAPIDNVVKGYLGARAGTPGFTHTVQTVEKFDRTAQEEAKKAATTAASGEKMQQYFSLLPILALIVVGFLVMKSLAKAAKSSNVLVAALPGGGTVTVGGRSRSGGTSMVSTEGGPSKPRFTQQEEEEDIESISTKINRPLEAIKKMTDERPEVVAMLIKSWLLEDRH